MARDTMASLRAELDALRAQLANGGTSEASAHYMARDIPCNATPRCTKTFRTEKGRDWHTANVKHGK